VRKALKRTLIDVVPVSLNMSARIIIIRSAITELLMQESIRALAVACDLLAAGTTESR
jgi:hypothetical protein